MEPCHPIASSSTARRSSSSATACFRGGENGSQRRRSHGASFEKLLEPVIANIRDSDVEAAIVHLDRRKAEINRRYSRSRAALSSPLPAPPAGPAGV